MIGVSELIQKYLIGEPLIIIFESSPADYPN